MPIHDPSYVRFVAELADQLPQLSLTDPKVNIFEMIRRAEVSISIPYSSPVYIASALNRPGIFYDSTSDLVPFFDRAPTVELCSGRQELQERLSTLMS